MLQNCAGLSEYRFVKIPGFTVPARIRKLSEREMCQYTVAAFDEETGEVEAHCTAARRRLLCVLSLVDDQGRRLFADTEAELLADWNTDVITALWQAAEDFNDVGGRQAKQRQQVQAKKN